MSDVNKFFAIYKYIVDGSAMHGDCLGLFATLDELNVFRVRIYNDLVDCFKSFPKDEDGHIQVDDLKKQQNAAWELFIALADKI